MGNEQGSRTKKAGDVAVHSIAELDPTSFEFVKRFSADALEKFGSVPPLSHYMYSEAFCNTVVKKLRSVSKTPFEVNRCFVVQGQGETLPVHPAKRTVQSLDRVLESQKKCL